MNILITGGTGYIGAHLAYELATRGERVVAYDVSPAYKALEGVKDVKVVKGDILDLPRLLHTIKEEKVDMIVHTAAMLTDESEQRPSSAFKINVEGTINCLEATRLFNLKRIVYISSRSVYGYTPIGKKINEDHPKEPVSIYGITKLMGEYFGLNYAKKYGIDFIALRFPIVFGIPRAPMSFRGVSGAIMDIIQKSSIGLPVHIPKGGEGVYEFIYIKDVIKALVLACYTSNLKHRVFNIGSGEVMSLWDFVNIVKEFIPNAKIEIGAGELLPSARGPLDCTRAYEELGFKNSYTIRSAIKEMIEELRNYSNPSAL